MKYTKLFSPMKIGNVDIKNRIVMPPMCMGLGQFDGTPTDIMYDYYEERAKGGVGLIITEITRVNDTTGATAFQQLGISHNYQIEPLRELANRVHKHGAKLFVQLHHPGRQNLGLLINTLPISIKLDKITSFYKKIFFKSVNIFKALHEKKLLFAAVGPSKVEASKVAGGRVRALRHWEIRRLIKQFVQAAIRVKKAGCDGVELHAAHGYLLQQFLSPHTNRRKDKYGGTFENRMRFLQEIIQGIRLACGSEFPIVVRLTVDECYDKIGKPGIGYNLEEGVQIAKYLESLGIDAIDVSSGAYDTYNYWLEPVSFEPGWRKHMAEAVKKEVKIPVIAANLIRSANQAESQLNKKVQDFIALGRPLIADPYWVNKVQDGRETEVKRCISCLYCMESMMNNAYEGYHGECSVNPFVGKEKMLINLKRNGERRKIVVVGAGPAGLLAAELLLKRDFDVEVYEKSSAPGGQVKIAGMPKNKLKTNWIYIDLENEVKRLGGKIHYNKTVNRDLIFEIKPYAVVLATGGVPCRPTSIPGINGPNVHFAVDVIQGEVSIKNKKVALIGSGMTGLEAAEILVKDNNDLTIVEMEKSLAPNTWFQHIDDVMPTLEKHNTKIVLNNKLVAIDTKSITVERVKTGKKLNIPVDAVILSMGVRPCDQLYKDLVNSYKNVFLVGDADKTGCIANATKSAYDVAINKID